MSNLPGVFCVSIDTTRVESEVAQLGQRRQDVLQLLERFQMPSNWTTATPPTRSLPPHFETTMSVAKQTTRRELIDQIRHMNAALLRDGRQLEAVVLDPHEARSLWDVLVRQGCHVARPRTATASLETNVRTLRGGLWCAPLSCSFVGGSRRSVRQLFSGCQRRLVETVGRGELFHLNIDLGNSRSSWKEEVDALRALLQTANELRNKQRLNCIHLSQVPQAMCKNASTPMTSILRRAA